VFLIDGGILKSGASLTLFEPCPGRGRVVLARSVGVESHFPASAAILAETASADVLLEAHQQAAA
jgi:hypothetical protein